MADKQTVNNRPVGWYLVHEAAMQVGIGIGCNYRVAIYERHMQKRFRRYQNG